MVMIILKNQSISENLKSQLHLKIIEITTAKVVDSKSVALGICNSFLTPLSYIVLFASVCLLI
jgi:hypothetical protein